MGTYNWTPEQLAATRAFFASNPSPDQIFATAQQNGMSAGQLADAYAAATGGDGTAASRAIYDYMGRTGQNLTGGAQVPLAQQAAPAPAPIQSPTQAVAGIQTASAANSSINPASGLRTYNQAGMYVDPGAQTANPVAGAPAPQTGAPPSLPGNAGGYPGANNPTQQQLASPYIPTSWNSQELNAVREFFRTNPTPDQIYQSANELGLSPTQLADVYSQTTGNDYNSSLNSINQYLTQNNKTLAGGYSPLGQYGSTGGAGGAGTTNTGTTNTGSAGTLGANTAGLQGAGNINLYPAYTTGYANDLANYAGGVLGNIQNVYQDWYSNPLTTGVTPQLQNVYNQMGTPNTQWSEMAAQGGQQAQQSAQYDPNQLQQHLSPYLNQASQAVYDSANRNLTENVLPRVNSTFAGAGQFGGTRNADFTNRAIRDSQEGASRAVAGLQSNAWNQANQTYSDWANKGVNTGANMANIANIGSGIDTRNLQTSLTGAMGQQGLEQQSLDATYKDWLARQQFPLGALQQAGGALNNLGTIQPNQFQVGQTTQANTASNSDKVLAALNYLTSNQGASNLYNTLNLIPSK